MEKSKESLFASDASGVKLKDSPTRMDDIEPEIFGAVFTSSELAVLPLPQPARSDIPTAKATIFFGAMLTPSKTSHFLTTKIHRARI